MLPFLKPKPAPGGISTVMRKPDSDKPQENEGLSLCARDLIDGIQSGDSQKVASSLKAAFMILDAMPHEEGPHEESSEESESE